MTLDIPIIWANDITNWTLEDWQRVAWSNESKFKLFQDGNRVSSCQQGTMQTDSGSIMVCSSGMDWVHWPTLTCHWQMTAMLHCIMTIPPHSWTLCVPAMMCYSSRIMYHVIRFNQNWFQEHLWDFQWIACPPCSLNMNPIKHLWVLVQKSIHTKGLANTNSSYLWAATEAAWPNFSPNVFLPQQVTALC